MSVPRPAMFVDTVMAPLVPAMATMCASRSWFLAFSTSWATPRSLSRPERCSEFSTDAVPTSTGWPVSCTRSISSQIASHFSGSVR